MAAPIQELPLNSAEKKRACTLGRESIIRVNNRRSSQQPPHARVNNRWKTRVNNRREARVNNSNQQPAATGALRQHNRDASQQLESTTGAASQQQRVNYRRGESTFAATHAAIGRGRNQKPLSDRNRQPEAPAAGTGNLSRRNGKVRTATMFRGPRGDKLP